MSIDQEEMTRESNLHTEQIINQKAVGDLFQAKMTDKDRLWEWLKGQEFVKTSAIIAWGSRNFSNRADRNARQLASEGKLVRISDEEKAFRFQNCREDVYRIIK